MRLTDRDLNRALMARQGLIKPYSLPVAEVAEAIGALQAQNWSSVPAALWSRMDGLPIEEFHRAMNERELVIGTSIRRTLHLVSAREHPAYSATAQAGGVNDWWRSKAEPTAQADKMRADVLKFAAKPRTSEELNEFIEAWVAKHPKAFAEEELATQRQYKWRPLLTWSALVRAPAGEDWAKTPSGYQAAPGKPPAAKPALETVIRCHLRAFGPAAADDVATWIGWKTPPVREALEAMPDLERFTDEHKRTLYDLPGAPLPGGDAEVPVRFLPSFDSTLLAYAHKYRERILPAAYKDEVYAKANLQVKATFLVDGKVAGLWSSAVRRRNATLTLTPFAKLSKDQVAALSVEGDRFLRFVEPTATMYGVSVAQK